MAKMFYSNDTKADRSGAHPQYYAIQEFYGKTVEVIDLSGLSTPQVVGELKGGKTPYNEFVVITEERIALSFPTFVPCSIETCEQEDVAEYGIVATITIGDKEEWK